MASDMCFTVVELTLSGDLDKFRNYFYNWRLELNTNKTVFSAFHLTVCLAGYGLNITTMGERVPFKKKHQNISVSLLTIHFLTPNIY